MGLIVKVFITNSLGGHRSRPSVPLGTIIHLHGYSEPRVRVTGNCEGEKTKVTTASRIGKEVLRALRPPRRTTRWPSAEWKARGANRFELQRLPPEREPDTHSCQRKHRSPEVPLHYSILNNADCGPVLVRPHPSRGFGLVDAVFVRVIAALDLHVQEAFFGVAADLLQARHAVDGVHRQAEAVNVVVDGQFKRRVDVALLLVTAHMHVVVIVAAVSEAMNQPRVSVEVEDDRLVEGEE